MLDRRDPVQLDGVPLECSEMEALALGKRDRLSVPHATAAAPLLVPMQDCELPSQIDRQCLEGPMGAASPGSTHETAYRSPDWSADPSAARHGRLPYGSNDGYPMFFRRGYERSGELVSLLPRSEPMMESVSGGGLERMAGSIAAASERALLRRRCCIGATAAIVWSVTVGRSAFLGADPSFPKTLSTRLCCSTFAPGRRPRHGLPLGEANAAASHLPQERAALSRERTRGATLTRRRRGGAVARRSSSGRPFLRRRRPGLAVQLMKACRER